MFPKLYHVARNLVDENYFEESYRVDPLDPTKIEAASLRKNKKSTLLYRGYPLSLIRSINIACLIITNENNKYHETLSAHTTPNGDLLFLYSSGDSSLTERIMDYAFPGNTKIAEALHSIDKRLKGLNVSGFRALDFKFDGDTEETKKLIITSMGLESGKR